MGSAKVIIKQQDRSAIVPSMSGISIGTVVNSKWGPITPNLTTSPNDLLDKYYSPDNTKGSSWNGAELLLASSSSVWITRAIHDDARYSSSLVRFKTDPVDFNIYPLPNATVDPVVKDVAGLGLEDFDSFQFPLYATTREYSDTNLTVISSLAANRLSLSSLGSLKAGDVISFGDSVDNSSNIYTLSTAEEIVTPTHSIKFLTPVTAVSGTELKYDDGTGTFISYVPSVYVIESVTNSDQVLVNNSDLVLNDSVVSFDDGLTQIEVVEKRLVNISTYEIQSSANFGLEVVPNAKIQLLIEDETEHRDAFLVRAIYPGDLGDDIKVGIRHSSNYDKAFYLDVYFKDSLEESFEVTRFNSLDGFGRQLNIETKINGASKYIVVKNNDMVDDAEIPLETSYGVWRELEKDIFSATTSVLLEDVLLGDNFITANSFTEFNLGDRLRLTANGYEYKVKSKSGNTLELDRDVLETRVIAGSVIYKFNPDLNDPSSGIFNGVQYAKFTKTSVFTDNKIGDSYSISGKAGKILDAGTNNLVDGFDGSYITLFDVINAFNKMGNKEKYSIAIFCDNGFAYPEVAIAIDELSKKTNLSHGYLSTSYESEKMVDITAVRDYRNSTNLNTEYSSIFSGWIQVTDVYNQTKVWVAPSIFGVLSQSFVTRNYYMFTPAAGWVFGRLNGLDITRRFTEGERDYLVDAQINPIRYREGYGLAIWGNETLYVKPSPLQLRSVAMLLIMLKYGLENFLEFELFQTNDEPEWTKVETAIDVFIRDNLSAGLYDWKVWVKDIITDGDIDARRMPIFVGLQPTMDIKEIPVTLGIFNRSIAISV